MSILEVKCSPKPQRERYSISFCLCPFLLLEQHRNAVSSFSCTKHPFIMSLLSHPTFSARSGDLICILCIICLPFAFVLCLISHFFIVHSNKLFADCEQEKLLIKKFMLSFQFGPQRYEKTKRNIFGKMKHL